MTLGSKEGLANLAQAVTAPGDVVLVPNPSYPIHPYGFIIAGAVAFTRAHGLFILSDLAYAEIYFDGEPPPSVLQVPGAKDLAVEFTSMSKTCSMAGRRIGFGVGNRDLISALTRVKSYLDYGAFTPIQVAAATALNGPQGCVRIALVENTQRTRQAARNVRRFLRDAAPGLKLRVLPPRLRCRVSH